MPHGGRPPEPPELPAGADPAPRWPLWYAPVGFLAGFAIVLVVSAIAGIIAAAAGADIDETPPELIVVLTLLQAVILSGTAIWLASRIRKPRPWHFGLRRAPLLAVARVGRARRRLLLRVRDPLLGAPHARRATRA